VSTASYASFYLCDGLFVVRDSFEDELRAFDGGVDGFLPCVWDDEISNFPQVVILLMLSHLSFVYDCLKQ
jgi:hypothetical protein